MNWKLLLVGMTILLCIGVAARWYGARDTTFDLTILHTNDLHAHYDSFSADGGAVGGIARIATVVRDVRGETANVLLFDAGDQFQGSLYFNVGGASVVAEVMNAVGYDGMCLGNHEFDSGPAELARFIDLVDFPILSANVDALAGSSLSEKILPLDVYVVGGKTIAVFGLTTETTASASSPGPDVQFLPAYAKAATVVEFLERQGVKIIIALTHLGYARDIELAKAVSGIDAIIGGHSHTLLGEAEGAYPTVVTSTAGEPVVIVSAHEWGRVLGRVDLTFDDEGVVVAAIGAPIAIEASIPEDPEVTAVLAPYVDAIALLKTEVIGTADVALDGERSAVRSRETNLGDLIADAVLWKTAALGTQVAIQNGGGIRASIPAGDVTMGQVLEVLPFGNQISIVSVTGEQLRAALENGVSQVTDGSGCFPQLAGARFVFDLAAEPGSRVASLDVWDRNTQTYAPVTPQETYIVATNSFLTDGGDGYVALAAGTDRYDTGWLLSDCLAEYLQSTSPVSPAVEGRIQVVEAAGP